MKPRIFIGSSVEGLSAAYSIQQNLLHDAEVTVWDQGVFELSKTTIESLTISLENSDFGIFVFSPDDIIKIRDKESHVVRDNVLFEFGLFIGKLSRERVFFVISSGIDFHLPTDLIGITPGTYDSNRQDNSLQAATGPVCHQIRLQIKKLGFLNIPEEILKVPINNLKKEDKDVKVDNLYEEIFVNKNYEMVIKHFEDNIKKEKNKKKILENKAWIVYCTIELDKKKGYNKANEVLKEHENDIAMYKLIATIYTWNENYEKAINLLKAGLRKFTNDPTLIALLAEFHSDNDDVDLAENLLEPYLETEDFDILFSFFKVYNSQKDLIKAQKFIHRAYNKNPKHESVRLEYAKLAMEINQNEIALYLLNSLTKDFPLNSEYWGYYSNASINLSLYNIGLITCKKANELAKEKEDWILMNIGNILNNKGFYTEGTQYLKKGLEIDNSSQYGHDRLALALKSAQEEDDKSKAIIKQGKKLMLEFNTKEE